MSSPQSRAVPEFSNPECRSSDEIGEVGIHFNAAVLVTSSKSRKAFHVPRAGTGDLLPICPSETNKGGGWKDKTAGQVTPTYKMCSRCAQYLQEHGTRIALEPDQIFLDEEGVIPLD
jgi:hypothetical protein